MQEILLNKNNYFEKFLNCLEKEINTKDFSDILKKSQEIDSKYYKKMISVNLIKDIIKEYKNINVFENNLKTCLILLPGNPEIVFRLGIEAVRNNVDFLIGIEDFCFAQNVSLIETINNVMQDLRLKNKIELKNLINDSEIINVSKQVEKTIVIGNSNLYNRLKSKIDVTLNPYGIFEIYSDSEDFKELQEMIFEIFAQNQFETEFFDDLEFDDAIKFINKQGYKFCAILFTNDKKQINDFKEQIKSEYIIVNKNPFKEIKFKLEI